jgi:transketolase
MAAGIALAGKKNGLEYRTFAIVGDGECDEGSVWEMALFAHQQKLTNFTVIVDHNKQQGLGDTSKIMDMMDIKKKWEDFGWNTVEIDGHNHKALKKAMSIVDSTRPTCIIADTIKGKGVPFMENNVLWHYRAPQGEDYTKAIEALEAIRP